MGARPCRRPAFFADFWLRAHRLVEKGEPLTTEVLNDLYRTVLKDSWGDAVTIDDFYKFTWARIPHFFNTPYYVFQYATCFASSAQLYGAMTTGAPGATLSCAPTAASIRSPT